MSLDPIVREVGTTYGPERGPGPTQGCPPGKGSLRAGRNAGGSWNKTKAPRRLHGPDGGVHLGSQKLRCWATQPTGGRGCFQAFREFRFSFVHRTNTLHHVERIKI